MWFYSSYFIYHNPKRHNIYALICRHMAYNKILTVTPKSHQLHWQWMHHPPPTSKFWQSHPLQLEHSASIGHQAQQVYHSNLRPRPLPWWNTHFHQQAGGHYHPHWGYLPKPSLQMHHWQKYRQWCRFLCSSVHLPSVQIQGGVSASKWEWRHQEQLGGPPSFLWLNQRLWLSGDCPLYQCRKM